MADSIIDPIQLKYLRLTDDGTNKEIQQVYWQNTVDSVLVTNPNNSNAVAYTITASYNNPTLRNIIEQLGELAFLDVNTSSGGVVNITVQTAEVANNVSSSLENTIKSWISDGSVTYATTAGTADVAEGLSPELATTINDWIRGGTVSYAERAVVADSVDWDDVQNKVLVTPSNDGLMRAYDKWLLDTMSGEETSISFMSIPSLHFESSNHMFTFNAAPSDDVSTQAKAVGIIQTVNGDSTGSEYIYNSNDSATWEGDCIIEFDASVCPNQSFVLPIYAILNSDDVSHILTGTVHIVDDADPLLSNRAVDIDYMSDYSLYSLDSTSRTTVGNRTIQVITYNTVAEMIGGSTTAYETIFNAIKDYLNGVVTSLILPVFTCTATYIGGPDEYNNSTSPLNVYKGAGVGSLSQLRNSINNIQTNVNKMYAAIETLSSLTGNISASEIVEALENRLGVLATLATSEATVNNTTVPYANISVAHSDDSAHATSADSVAWSNVNNKPETQVGTETVQKSANGLEMGYVFTFSHDVTGENTIISVGLSLNTLGSNFNSNNYSAYASAGIYISGVTTGPDSNQVTVKVKPVNKPTVDIPIQITVRVEY